jgi:hypothetical protein
MKVLRIILLLALASISRANELPLGLNEASTRDNIKKVATEKLGGKVYLDSEQTLGITISDFAINNVHFDYMTVEFKGSKIDNLRFFGKKIKDTTEQYEALDAINTFFKDKGKKPLVDRIDDLKTGGDLINSVASVYIGSPCTISIMSHYSNDSHSFMPFVQYQLTGDLIQKVLEKAEKDKKANQNASDVLK